MAQTRTHPIKSASIRSQFDRDFDHRALPRNLNESPMLPALVEGVMLGDIGIVNSLFAWLLSKPLSSAGSTALVAIFRLVGSDCEKRAVLLAKCLEDRDLAEGM